MPPGSEAAKVEIKWSIVVTYRFASLEPMHMTFGVLDPGVGLAVVESSAIAYRDVISIAVWRRIAWTPLVGAVLALPLAVVPALIGALAAQKNLGLAAVFLVMALPASVLVWWLLRLGVTVGRRYARVVGRSGSTTVQFDMSRAFHEELFRRCGLAPPAMP